MKINTAPRSDQWNADDFVGSAAKTFTITDVTEGTAEGARHDIHLAEGGGRVWRPPVTMLRLLTEAWGDESDNWIGKRVTLHRDASVRFGSDTPGGIRISHMSNLPNGKRMSVALTASRGRRSMTTVDPLPDGPAVITPEQVAKFERRIADAATLEALDVVAADLKACNLGGNRKPLLTAWSDRKAAIESTPAPAPEQAMLADVEMVTDEQIQDLAQAREQEYGKTAKAQQDWAAWVNETTGRTVGQDRNLTREEADDLLALLAAKDGAE